MNTLEERLERGGYYKRLEGNERDHRMLETARRDAELSGREMLPEMLDFEQAVIDKTTALVAEYESTVRVVDARNDLEFDLLHMQNALEISADELEQTDPEKAARMHELFSLDEDPDDG